MSSGDLPLRGLRVLAIEQMQALPFATQLLGRLGADVVKVEPLSGESGRHSVPSMVTANGEVVGATFLRNNFNKRSICVDLKRPEGRALVLSLARKFDVIADLWSMGLRDGTLGPVIVEAVPTSDGHVIVQVGREQHFARMCELLGRPEWIDDPRFATRAGWIEHLDDVIRPELEAWGAT